MMKDLPAIAFALTIILILSLSPSISFADNLNDNPLVPLLNGEKLRSRLEINGMFPMSSEGAKLHRRQLRDENIPRDFSIYVNGSGQPERSYLYIFVDGFSKPSTIWTVGFNDNLLVESAHSESIGGRAIGDGQTDIERQTFFFNVTGMVSPGENTLTITDVDSPTKQYFFDGALLLNFYPSDEEHEYWLYHGWSF